MNKQGIPDIFFFSLESSSFLLIGTWESLQIRIQPYLHMHMAKVHYINPQVKSQAVIFVQCKLSVLGQEQL